MEGINREGEKKGRRREGGRGWGRGGRTTGRRGREEKTKIELKRMLIEIQGNG